MKTARFSPATKPCYKCERDTELRGMTIVGTPLKAIFVCKTCEGEVAVTPTCKNCED